jgi:hypothetical protein
MPADALTPYSIIISSLRKLGQIGAAQPDPESEDLELAMNEFNELSEEWNTSKRNAFFQHREQFEFRHSKFTYSIGPRAKDPDDNPDFIVSSGSRPAKIDFCQLVLTDQFPHVHVQMAIIQTEQYNVINVPTLSSNFPLILYYQPTWPNGTIFLYPTYPWHVFYRLNMTWWHQLETVARDELHIRLNWPFGYARAFALTLAESLYLAFPKKTDLAELSRQARHARASIQSLNVPPPKVSTTDGITQAGTTLDWRSRTFL